MVDRDRMLGAASTAFRQMQSSSTGNALGTHDSSALAKGRFAGPALRRLRAMLEDNAAIETPRRRDR
jgi:hypothetical protein